MFFEKFFNFLSKKRIPLKPISGKLYKIEIKNPKVGTIVPAYKTLWGNSLTIIGRDDYFIFLGFCELEGVKHLKILLKNQILYIPLGNIEGHRKILTDIHNNKITLEIEYDE